MVVGPTAQASGKLRLLGSFQKSMSLGMQIFLPRKLTELCCYTGQLCRELFIFILNLQGTQRFTKTRVQAKCLWRLGNKVSILTFWEQPLWKVSCRNTASPLSSKGQPREEVALRLKQHPANTEPLSGGPGMVFSFEMSINSKQVFMTQTPGIIKVNKCIQNTYPQCWCHSFPIPTAFQKRCKHNTPDETQNE